MPFSLLQLSREELLECADARLPAALASRVEEGALPPSFVAARALKLIADGKAEFWCNTFLIVRNRDQRIIGGCGFKDAPKDGRVEIGYGVSPSSRGQGAATAAVGLLLQLAFGKRRAGGIRGGGPGQPGLRQSGPETRLRQHRHPSGRRGSARGAVGREAMAACDHAPARRKSDGNAGPLSAPQRPPGLHRKRKTAGISPLHAAAGRCAHRARGRFSSAVQALVLGLQLFARLRVIRVGNDAVGGAHVDALRLVVRADAFGAFGRVDDVDRRAGT